MKKIRDILRYQLAVLVLIALVSHPAAAGTVGFIMTADIPYYNEIHSVFLEEMGAFLEQQGMKTVVQKPRPDPMSWTNAARKLTTLGCAVIVTYGLPATLTTMKTTSDIPIVFGAVYNPAALNIAGKNATGVSGTVAVETILNKLTAIRKVRNLGVVFDKSEKDSILQARDAKSFEASLGFRCVLLNARQKMAPDSFAGVDAVLLTSCANGMLSLSKIMDATRSKGLPTGALIGGGENQGVLLTVVAAPREQGREVAAMVKKLLGGTKVSTIPIQDPKEVAVLVNVKEANALGLNLPAEVLNAATKTIE